MPVGKYIRIERRSLPEDLRIEISPADHPDARKLLLQLYAEQCDIYGFADQPQLDSARHTLPNGAFVIARAAGTGPVGCGGFRMHPHRTRVAEIKRMYVVPAWRCGGLGRRLLTHLETLATDFGASDLLLETGCANNIALHLYHSAGYQAIAPYVAGRDRAVNRAFTKKLANKVSSLPLPA